MSHEITFKVSDLLERIGSITKDDLLRSGSRIIWMDHVERLIKQEGVYWLISLDKEFVFDLATRDGMIYLIRNYTSKDNNIVYINLNKLPKEHCIIQVAWDVDYIEITISFKQKNDTKELKDYTAKQKTESAQTPTELLLWADKKNYTLQNVFVSEEDFRMRLIEIIKGTQRIINTYSNLNEFWNTNEHSKKNQKHSPRTEKEIHNSLINLISDQLKITNIHFTSETESPNGNTKLIFSSKVEGGSVSTIVMEVINAHSSDLINEIVTKFPSYMKFKKSKFGIFLVLWYKGERFDKPNYESAISMELNMSSSFHQANYYKDYHNISVITLDLSGEIGEMRHLNIANSTNLKFEKNDTGSYVLYNNKKIIFGTFLMILKRDKHFTDYQLLRLAKDNLRAYCTSKKLSSPSIRNFKVVSAKEIINDYTPFYKYVQPDIFEKYIKNGNWQLGTIEQYRTIENSKQRDEFEGFCFLHLNINNHIVGTNLITGFNYLILCGTKEDNSSFHKTNFGEKVLYFADVKTFAERVCKIVKAKKYYIHNVEYNTLKSYVSNDKIYNKYLELENLLAPPFFDIISQHILYPSLFVKPENFKQENEVRIVFELDNDCFEPYKFEDKSLLNYFKY